MHQNSYEFFCTCPQGFEQILAQELASLGISHLRPLQGQVSFYGPLKDAYKACLWSHLASRVIVVLARISARSSDDLYEGIQSIAWEEQLGEQKSFAVNAHGTNTELRNSQFVALRTKDAIVDYFLSKRGVRPQIDTHNPDLSIQVRIQRDKALIGIDLAGEPLFHRGYERTRSAQKGFSNTKLGFLRPDYAAALLATGAWYKNCRHTQATLVALYSGSGTLLVEAAAQALDRAPGLLRLHWGFEGWSAHDAKLWEELYQEADTRAQSGQNNKLRLISLDSRKGAVTAAKHLMRAAGLSADIQSCTLDTLSTHLQASPHNVLACCDLSWIEDDELAYQAASLAQLSAFASSFAREVPEESKLVVYGADAYANSMCDRALGCTATEFIETRSGQHAARLSLYNSHDIALDLPKVNITTPQGIQESVTVLMPSAEQFAARLHKVYRQRRKWAQREDISCYRIYDADLPDYAVSIDLFQEVETANSHPSSPRRCLQIYEYAAPRSVEPQLARSRLLDVLTLAPRILAVDPQDVHVRVRTRAKGGSQYANEAHAEKQGSSFIIDEGGLNFEVNFSSRLDCGIFLDHRETRSLVRELMKKTKGSKRFLNLFAYTGTASCYAADGGAHYTTTVDMSKPSLDWARRNMERNGFTNRGANTPHEYIQADVLSWVQEMRHSSNRWDLIFCDVPTFSNSKRMRKESWDVQRDHAELIITLSRLLTRDGCALFSCNLRNFKPDVQTLKKAGVSLEDITTSTIPEDFKRNANIHHAYIVRRKASEK